MSDDKTYLDQARALSRRPAQGRNPRTMTAVRRLDAIVAVDFLATRAFMGEDGAGSEARIEPALRERKMVPTRCHEMPRRTHR